MDVAHQVQQPDQVVDLSRSGSVVASAWRKTAIFWVAVGEPTGGRAVPSWLKGVFTKCQYLWACLSL